MKVKLHAKGDGLWLELEAGGKKKNRTAVIHLGAKEKLPSGGIIQSVIEEVWNELHREQRRSLIETLSNRNLTEKLGELSRTLSEEGKWLIEEAVDRWGVDLDEDDE